MKVNPLNRLICGSALLAMMTHSAYGAPRRACSETTGIRRLAVLLTYYGNADRTDSARAMDGLEKTLRANGYRIIRLDNTDTPTLEARLALDKKMTPCEYTSRTPLFVAQGTGELQPRADGQPPLHWLVTHRITTEFPTDLAPFDAVVPNRKRPGSVYQVTRRIETRQVVSALIRGAGDNVRSNLVLATQFAPQAALHLTSEDRNSLSSVTLCESKAIAPLLARLRDAADKPEAFDVDGDGRVSNQELFPEAAPPARSTALAPWEQPRPQPAPVPSVRTEGMGFVVGYNAIGTGR